MNGKFAPISHCYLQTSRLKMYLTKGMNILEVENPESGRWSFLEDLGVACEPNLGLFLHHLRLQKGSITAQFDGKGIEDRLYADLVSFCLRAKTDNVLQ